jgi:16S rRNA G527 N7-methylase RsmG
VKNNALTLSEIMELLMILLKVNQETPVFRNNPSKDEEQKSKKGAIDYEYRRNKIVSLRWKCLKCERLLLSSQKMVSIG